MSIQVPRGFRLAAVHCGVKSDPAREDLTLIVSEEPATAAAVYTTNRVASAPVQLNRRRTPSDHMRAVVINSGVANACTGERGVEDADQMARLAAKAAGATADEALVLSTGVIGQFLPMEKITDGIRAAATRLASDDAAFVSAARGMMTTDTVHKMAGRTVELAGTTVHVSGMAKGAGMIAPRMATMLAVVMTDAALDPQTAQGWIADAADQSFNSISVDGHTSTSDTVVLLASGAAGPIADSQGAESIRNALVEVCVDLARAIVDDGEGATHLVTIDVLGCKDRPSARAIARTVAESLLVKTAIAGADPNWGRIVSAVGYAPVEVDPAAISLEINGHEVYRDGNPSPFDVAVVSRSIRDNRETHLVIRLKAGGADLRFWTTDLTAEYVRLNAEYHT